MNLFVNFACNDDNGNFAGTVAKIDIQPADFSAEMLMEIEGPMEEIKDENDPWHIDLEATTRIRIDCEKGLKGARHFLLMEDHSVLSEETGVKEGWLKLPLVTYGTWTGSMAWNGGLMDVQHVAHLLAHLQSLGGWSCTMGESTLFEKFNRGERITAQDLGAEEEPERYVCPNTLPMPLEAEI